MATELVEQVAGLRRGDHVCRIYETPDEQSAAWIPFVREGLSQNEVVFYIVDEHTASDIRAALADAGVDVEAVTDRGALRIVTSRDTYRRDGEFEPAAMIDFLRETVEDALANEFAGVRFTGEMTGALEAGANFDRVVEYEAMLNRFFSESRTLGLCQYDRQRFAPAVIDGALRTHPIAILGEQVCPNLYYEPPGRVLGGPSLPDKVDWMISQLKRARASEQALEETSAAKSNFIACVSHELRTPLHGIVRYSDLLKLGIAGPLTERQREHLDRLDANTRHLLELVEQILTFSTLEAGREDVRSATVDLAALVREAGDLIEPAAVAKGLRLHVTVSPDSPEQVVTDPGKLRQILSCLLSNAVKFTDAGEIGLAVEREDGHVIFRVRDTGMGIPADRLASIFEPFRQLDAGSTRRVGGAGLGLTVSRQLARQLQGELTVVSAPGGGSTFTVRLPLGPPP